MVFIWENIFGFKKTVYSFFAALYMSASVRYLVAFLYIIKFSYELPQILRLKKKISGKKIIAINAFEIYQFQHIKDLYYELKKDPAYSVVLIGSNPKNIRQQKYRVFMVSHKLRVNLDLVSYVWLPLIRPSIFIETSVTTYSELCFGNSIKILYAHSVASLGFSKDHEHITKTGKYDYILSTGPYQKRVLSNSAKQFNVKLPKIFEAGFITGDRLISFAKKFSKIDFYKRCHLKNKPTLLFAPTWGEFSATKLWIDRVVELSLNLDCNLLIKLHPLMLKSTTEWESAGVDWPVKLTELKKNHDNIHICDSFDLDNYMLAADILVTDVSSVGIEFMILGKPVIFLPAPMFFEIYGKEKPIYWVREGLEIKNCGELKNKLLSYMKQEFKAPEYDIEKIVFHPGCAIKRICDFLKTL